MKLAVNMYSYYQTVRAGRMDIGGFIDEAAKIGAEGVELLDFFYKDLDVDRAAAKSALERTGLPCPIFSVAQNFAKPDAAEREAQLQKIRFGVDEAVFYGSQVVRVFAGDVAPGMTFEQARTWIIEGLTAASVYASDRGIKLALENHGKLAGRGDQVRGIVEDVRASSGTDALGANPDMGNFVLVNQPSEEAMKEVAPYAYMAHFKDFKPASLEEGGVYEALNGDRFEGKAIGEGIVNLHACLAELRSAGFDGWLSVEYEGTEDPITAVPRSIANAKRYL